MRQVALETAETMDRESGLSMVEITATLLVITVGVFALAAVLLTTTRLRESSELRADAIVRLQAMMERVKGSAPDAVETTFSGGVFAMGGLETDRADVSPVSVTVDATDPFLLDVQATTSWGSGAKQETLSLQTFIYNSKGV